MSEITGDQGESKRGRPMDPTRNQVIIETTLDLLAQVGYDSLTIEAIAQQARVGKATIYRRWPSKVELVIEAISSISPFESLVEKVRKSQSLRQQLIDLLCLCSQEEHEVYQQAMTAIGSVLPHNKDLELALHNNFYEKIRAAIATIITPFLLPNHELQAERLDLLADVGPALLIYRSFLVRKSFDIAYITRIVDHLILPMLQHDIISNHDQAQHVSK
ncbi:TetR/AcrR family transcriptional regulator [Alkalicoccobacillus porphyridii]|uniref:TetR/AcrR family transcriptional regulator n=1 Tax=Alkalicoccobacillus porphyridii TaxID=2597270 RepID=A0A553ZX04_9BACI|nr:TetR/AcrR family transcriptional regulator [Alkalicoccobacillus porphyridii]TSB45972.1 TetR/AcrR family transcriptional regulator [Alkalicoccobacillus porphyridii]